MQKTAATTVTQYNKLHSKVIRDITNLLQVQINKHLQHSISKIWHGSPVWFIDGNPIVAYSVRKTGSVSLMFFSGQSFDEHGLTPEGKFKAAEVLYTNVKEIKAAPLKRLLKKASVIQWDYKNLVKRKGVLKKVDNN